MVIFNRKLFYMKLNVFFALILVITLSACDREKDVAEPDFDVAMEAATAKAGEEVQFNFSGNPGSISFYSGEQGNDYAYKDEPRIDQIEQITLSFQTHNQEGNPLPNTSLASLKVMFSTDFSGTYDYAGVSAATWTDISSRFTIASPRAWGSNLGWFESGTVDISDLRASGKPFYIAYKYEVPTYSGTANQTRRWRMQQFRLNSLTSLGTVQSLGTYSPTNFSLISRDEPRATLSQLASSIVLFAPRAANAQESVEEWAVSMPFSADEINLGNEFSVAVKGYGNPGVKDFKHTYTKEGTYKATFVAKNVNIHNTKQVIRQIDVTILPK